MPERPWRPVDVPRGGADERQGRARGRRAATAPSPSRMLPLDRPRSTAAPWSSFYERAARLPHRRLLQPRRRRPVERESSSGASGSTSTGPVLLVGRASTAASSPATAPLAALLAAPARPFLHACALVGYDARRLHHPQLLGHGAGATPATRRDAGRGSTRCARETYGVVVLSAPRREPPGDPRQLELARQLEPAGEQRVALLAGEPRGEPVAEHAQLPRRARPSAGASAAARAEVRARVVGPAERRRELRRAAARTGPIAAQPWSITALRSASGREQLVAGARRRPRRPRPATASASSAQPSSPSGVAASQAKPSRSIAVDRLARLVGAAEVPGGGREHRAPDRERRRSGPRTCDSAARPASSRAPAQLRLHQPLDRVLLVGVLGARARERDRVLGEPRPLGEPPAERRPGRAQQRAGTSRRSGRRLSRSTRREAGQLGLARRRRARPRARRRSAPCAPRRSRCRCLARGASSRISAAAAERAAARCGRQLTSTDA